MANTFLRNLQFGFGISLLLVFASAIASYWSITKQLNSREDVEHSRKVIASANKILHDLQNAETGQRGFHLTGREIFLKPYNDGLKSIPESLNLTKSLVSDNPDQTRQIGYVEKLVSKRMDILNNLVSIKRHGGEVTLNQLEEGRLYMDSCRLQINSFIDLEGKLLDSRSKILDSSSFKTSIFIILAAAISLVITLLFYLKIKQDFIRREELQRKLKEKDAEISRRLSATQRIAARIAAGEYDVQVKDEEKDDLGILTGSLNEMSKALKSSFESIRQNEWLQTGLANLNEIVVGNKSEHAVLEDSLSYLINYVKATNGAAYLIEVESAILKASVALDSRTPKEYRIGEGIIGQVAKDKKLRELYNIDKDDFHINFANGQIAAKNILFLPLINESTCLGVIEIGSLHPIEPIHVEFFKECARTIAIAIRASRARAQVQDLLSETQAQTEELQVQHAELENLNTELEAQTQKLQASEEELRVQQDELLQYNKELELRSKLLEEKNIEIVDRNLEIQKKAEELALSTRYKSEFLANMSHELRTPLNSILLLSSLLADNTEHNLNEDQIESARVIQSSGKSLLELIDEILDLSKIESGKMQLDPSFVNTDDLVENLRNLFEPIIKEKALEFEVKFTESYNIETDRLRLEQILRNLISNAIKFTSRGSVTLSIDEDKEISNFILFEVQDSGIGIPLDKQRLIFEAFQQADGSTRRKFGGTGLGLSISRELAKLLGGEIRLESQVGKGSKFTLVIPKFITHKDRKEEKFPNDLASLAPEYPEIKDVAHNLSLVIPQDVHDDREVIQDGDKIILIVEDDVTFIQILLKYMRQEGYKCIVSVRGDKALGLAMQYKPAAILLDIMLPIQDGWQVLESLKDNIHTRHIPVHMMSSLESKKESLLKGAIDFVNKPVDWEQIGGMLTKIEQALSKHPKKVLIVEENKMHADALSLYLKSFNINVEVSHGIEDGLRTLKSDAADCVILDMGVPYERGYDLLEVIKKTKGLEHLPIIVFTGKNLSTTEQLKIKEYADSIVVKTAHSYQRILDEVGLFLHLIQENNALSNFKPNKLANYNEFLHGKKVLIADDDVRNIFSISKTLEKYQMEVFSCTNGKEALELISQQAEIDIVLMDIMMPEMDGYETIKILRDNPKFKNLPIIAVTAKAMIGDRDKCIEVGASDYISKPIDADQLISLLRVWLYHNNKKNKI